MWPVAPERGARLPLRLRRAGVAAPTMPMTQRGSLVRFSPPSLPPVPIVLARLARRDVDRRRPLVDERGHIPVAVDVPSCGFADQFAQHLACAESRTFTNASDHGVSLRSLCRDGGRIRSSATLLIARTAPSLVPFRQTFELRAASPVPVGLAPPWPCPEGWGSPALLERLPRARRPRRAGFIARPAVAGLVGSRQDFEICRQPALPG
jgi:hypothetical protein